MMRNHASVRLTLVSFEVLDQLLSPRPTFRSAGVDLYAPDERALEEVEREITRHLERVAGRSR